MIHIRRQILPQFLPTQKIIVEEERQPKIKKINQYLLISKLGSGSSAKVYLAQDQESHRFYAAKAIPVSERRHDGGQGVASLDREIRNMKQLNNEHLVKLHEALYAPKSDTAYLFLEWAECGTLQDFIQRRQYFNESALATIFHFVLKGLSSLHSAGIVHKDIKPSNILLFSSGVPKLADFGIGHSFQSAEAVIGSPAYQAPELFDNFDFDEEENTDSYFDEDKNEIDAAKGDIWSVGVSLYQTAFGILPYSGGNMYEIFREIYNKPLEIPNTSEHLEETFGKGNVHQVYSDKLINIIKQMLTVDHTKRPTLDEVLNNEFFKQASSNPQLNLPEFVPEPPSQQRKIVNIQAKPWDEGLLLAIPSKPSASFPIIRASYCC